MNSQASKTVEEETRMMDLSQDGTGPASSTSVPDDSILDKSDNDIEELEQTSSSRCHKKFRVRLCSCPQFH